MHSWNAINTMSDTFFSNFQNIHLVGIKGVAMTAMAQCLLDLKKTVSGSDVSEEFVTQQILDSLSVKVLEFNKDNITKDIDAVIYSGAHRGCENPEVVRAQELGIPVFSHAEALGEMMKNKQGISVCGVGGKSTTSAMIAWILEKAGYDPSFSVGVGKIRGLDRSGKYARNGKFFVAEADEYATDPGKDHTPRFMHQHPEVIVCTNLLFDHPDIYKSFDDTKKAYLDFFHNLSYHGHLIINADDKELVILAEKFMREVGTSRNIQLITISGSSSQADYYFSEYSPSKSKSSFIITEKNQDYAARLIIPGYYNAFNAVCAVAAASVAGIELSHAILLLEDFLGTIRRFEHIGEIKSVQYYDDYAHHPIEIDNILHEMNKIYPREKVIAIFQPHTFSRTKTLLNEFAKALSVADEVILLDIFSSARELFDPSVTSDMLADKIKSYGKIASNLHDLSQVAEYLMFSTKPGNVVVTLGAGDLYKLHKMIQ